MTTEELAAADDVFEAAEAVPTIGSLLLLSAVAALAGDGTESMFQSAVADLSCSSSSPGFFRRSLRALSAFVRRRSASEFSAAFCVMSGIVIVM